ncbi:cold-shock protein [Alicyclobacillus tolerans]|uniref:cold-inducible protein YdjO-related protein n=1 Tax=Alicyclobacillus tolerans TaxID=90970 RepID=UPI001F15D155|nr:cold-inducible protein YdjO-related protein [Alicyclobacillus tolerans]MCF8564301.1 cold-shock protein [Alicyclobacillus tolerans]
MAYNHAKKPVSEHVYADTTVWQCSECNCWSRVEFVLEEEPTCPLCNSKMSKEVKNIRIE